MNFGLNTDARIIRADASLLLGDMSHKTLVDLTGNSDEDRSVQSRPNSSKRMKTHHNGFYPTMRGYSLVDLTADEQDYPYLQSGTLGSPFPRSMQNVYRLPIVVTREPEVGFEQLKTPLSISDQAPVYRDIGQMNGALMELQGQMTVSRSPVPVKRQEDVGTLQQPTFNMNVPSPLPTNAPIALTEKQKSPVQDYTSKFDTSVVPNITRTENLFPVTQLYEDFSHPSPAAVNHVTPDVEVHLAQAEEPKELPLTLESFQSTLQKCLHELRVDHQYYIKVSVSKSLPAFIPNLRSPGYPTLDNVTPLVRLLERTLLSLLMEI